MRLLVRVLHGVNLPIINLELLQNVDVTKVLIEIIIIKFISHAVGFTQIQLFILIVQIVVYKLNKVDENPTFFSI